VLVVLFYCKSKAQGTIEYLVVMGIIIVVGLVVVAMLSGYLGSTERASSTISGISGKISAPISVLDVTLDPSGNGVARIQNNSGDTLTISSVGVGGKTGNYSPTVASTATQTFSLYGLQSSSCTCPSGFTGTKRCSITVRATSSNGLPLSWTLNDITVNCSTDATVPSGIPTARQSISFSTPYVWIPNSGSDSVSRLYDSNGASAGTFSGVGNYPYGVAIDMDGNVWIANDSAVVKVNGLTGAVIGSYGAANTPAGVAVDASNQVWVVNMGDQTLSKLNASTGATIGTYDLLNGSSAEGIAIGTNGSVWVANFLLGSVSKIDNSSGGIVGTYSVGSNPAGIAVDGSNNIWVTNAGSDSVSKLNGFTGGTIGTYGVGDAPQGIAIDSSGNVWVANNDANTVTKLNGSTGATIGTYSAGNKPYGIAVDVNGNVWVANVFSNNVTKLNGSTGATIGTYNVASNPYSLGDMTGFVLHYFVLGNQ
jgi:streptogramin lyase